MKVYDVITEDARSREYITEEKMISKINAFFGEFTLKEQQVLVTFTDEECDSILTSLFEDHKPENPYHVKTDDELNLWDKAKQGYETVKNHWATKPTAAVVAALTAIGELQGRKTLVGNAVRLLGKLAMLPFRLRKKAKDKIKKEIKKKTKSGRIEPSLTGSPDPFGGGTPPKIKSGSWYDKHGRGKP